MFSSKDYAFIWVYDNNMVKNKIQYKLECIGYKIFMNINQPWNMNYILKHALVGNLNTHN
jgi:hypothetical protein